MNSTARRVVYWAPRILGIALAAFLGIFALDVFGMPGGFWLKTAALLMHLVPTAVVLLALWIAWQREWIGAVIFPLMAVFYVASTWGRFHWATYAAIAGPLLLLGLLFWIDWRHRATHRPRPR